MRLYIGKQDIENAIKARRLAFVARGNSCPIAQSLARKYPEYEPWVGTHVIRLTSRRNPYREIIFYPSKAAISFIDRADSSNDQVKPIAITLREPAGY